MKFFDSLLHAVLPTPHNTYRPYLLRKEGLAFFLAVVLVAEGFYTASLYRANPAQDILAAAAAAPVNPEPNPFSQMQSYLRAFARAAGSPEAGTWVLAAAAMTLAALLVAAVVVHARVQAVDLLMQGGAVLLLALFLLWCNAVVQPAAGDNALAAPGPAQYHW